LWITGERQTLVGVDRDAQMLGVVVGDLPWFPRCSLALTFGWNLQRVDHRTGDERQIGEG